jgi:hypothetical protein
VRDDQQIPAFAEVVADVAGDMAIAAPLIRQEVARPRVKAALEESITNGPRKFASDEHTWAVKHTQLAR